MFISHPESCKGAAINKYNKLIGTISCTYTDNVWRGS